MSETSELRKAPLPELKARWKEQEFEWSSTDRGELIEHLFERADTYLAAITQQAREIAELREERKRLHDDINNRVERELNKLREVALLKNRMDELEAALRELVEHVQQFSPTDHDQEPCKCERCDNFRLVFAAPFMKALIADSRE